MDYAEYLLIISLTEYRKIRKAVNVLVRAGVSRENAMSVIINAHKDRFVPRTFEQSVKLAR